MKDSDIEKLKVLFKGATFPKLTDGDRFEMARCHNEYLNSSTPEQRKHDGVEIAPGIRVRIIPGHYRRDVEGSC